MGSISYFCASCRTTAAQFPSLCFRLPLRYPRSRHSPAGRSSFGAVLAEVSSVLFSLPLDLLDGFTVALSIHGTDANCLHDLTDKGPR